MFQKSTNFSNINSDIKPDSVRLCAQTEALASNNNNNDTNSSSNHHDCSTSSSKQPHLHPHHDHPPQHHFHNHNYKHPHTLIQSQNQQISSGPKEDSKSARRLRNFHSPSQHSHQPAYSNQQPEMQPSNNNNNNLNQRTSGQQQLTSNSIFHPDIPPSQKNALSRALSSSYPQSTSAITNSSSKSALSSELHLPSGKQQLSNRQTAASSINAMLGHMSQKSREEFHSVLNNNARIQDQQEKKETNEVVTVIKEELEKDDLACLEDVELEGLGSLERNLPVELSFLIRQQAYCMARMNYLDRQIRELKEAKQTVAPIHSSPSQNNNNQAIRNTINNATNAANKTTSNVHNKNGNFIPSDDSGGEYSRATISDDDELSSLLDQIAKSVRPERSQSIRSNPQQQQQQQQHHHQQQQQQQTQQQRPMNYSIISNQPQQYTIINSNQLHHQAVPVFVMGSPIAVAHPSSISSTVLPGVHFQPEPRYNQYYEDFYVQNTPSSSTLHRPNGIRSQQFDSSITAIEQLVSQKEKRQIKHQLKSADNWLKMRSSGLCNLNGNFGNTSIGTINDVVLGDVDGSCKERKLPASSSSATLATENSNSVIEENRSR